MIITWRPITNTANISYGNFGVCYLNIIVRIDLVHCYKLEPLVIDDVAQLREFDLDPSIDP